MSRPRIRKAKFGDIPAMHEIVAESHERSRYAAFSSLPVQDCKSLLMTAVQRHNADLRKAGGFFVAVADNGERLEGLVVGILQPLYQVLDTLQASDLFWYCRPGAHPMSGYRLMRAFHKWVPEGAIITNATSDVIGDPEPVGKMLEHMGMRCIGKVYEKEKRG